MGIKHGNNAIMKFNMGEWLTSGFVTLSKVFLSYLPGKSGKRVIINRALLMAGKKIPSPPGFEPGLLV